MKSVKHQLREYVIVSLTTIFFTAVVMLLVFALDYENIQSATGEARYIDIRNDILGPVLFGAPTFFFMAWKLRALARIRRELEGLAFTDGLTKILNRRAFQNAVETALRADNAKPATMMVIDVDHFKGVNDSHGHEVGDQALVAIAQVILQNLHHGELFGRIGGEEFAVFAPFATPQLAQLQAEHLRLAVQNSAFSNDVMRGGLTVSMGVSHTLEKTTYGQLYREADLCLYAAKEAGRNRIVSINDNDRKLAQIQSRKPPATKNNLSKSA